MINGERAADVCGVKRPVVGTRNAVSFLTERQEDQQQNTGVHATAKSDVPVWKSFDVLGYIACPVVSRHFCVFIDE